jgi:4-amino-4-deoxy-L-arabinose transferase-like glycosyltransferase
MSRWLRHPYLFLLLSSLLLHLPGLRAPLLDYHAHRQTQTASMSRNFARHGMHFFSPEVDTEGAPRRTGTEFPLYSYLLAVLFKLFGPIDWLGRILSSVLTAASTLFLFAFLRRRFGEKVALLGSLLMCVIPVHLYFTRTVQPESMAMFGFLGFLWAYDRWLAAGAAGDLVAAIALGALAPLHKLPFLWLIGGLWLTLTLEQPGAWRRQKSYVALPWIVLLTLAWYQYARTAPIQVLPLDPEVHEKNMAALHTLVFWRKQFVSWIPEVGATYAGLVLALLGACRARQTGKNGFFLAGWTAATVAYTILLGEYGMIHRYTLLPWAPLIGTLAAMGAAGLWRPGPWQEVRRLLAVILTLGIPIHAGFRIAHWYRLERLYLLRAAPRVQALSRPDDLFLTNTAEIPVLLYFLDRTGWARDLDEATPEDIEAMRARGVRFFFTPTAGSWTRHPQWNDYFRRHARLLDADPDYLLYEFR